MYRISPKKIGIPLFTRFLKWVCRASQVRMDDGTSVEDAVASVENAVAEIGQSSGGSGSDGMLKLSFCGFGEESNGKVNNYVLPDESVTNADMNCVPKSQVDAILAAPMGSIVAICESWINENGNFVDSRIVALGVKVETWGSGDCDITISLGSEEILPTHNVEINSQAGTNGILRWYTPK